MNIKVNIIWLSQYNTNAIKSDYNDLQSCSCIYYKQMLETIHITSCDLASSGRYWVQDAEKVFIEVNPEKFAEAQRDEGLLKEAGWCGHALQPFQRLLSLLANFSPAWERLETIKIRQVLWKMTRKEIFSILPLVRIKGQKSPRGDVVV